MKPAVVLLGLGLLLIFLQTSVLPQLLPEHFKPDLLLVLVLYLGLTESCLRGGLFSWVLGCFEDVFAGSDFGLFGLIFLLIFLAVRALASRFNTESTLLLLLLTLVASLVKGILLIGLMLLFSEPGGQWTVIFSRLLPEALLNTVGALLLLKSVRYLRRRYGRGAGIPGLSHLDRRYES